MITVLFDISVGRIFRSANVSLLQLVSSTVDFFGMDFEVLVGFCGVMIVLDSERTFFLRLSVRLD